jgi:hypothetical protein
MTMKYDYVAVPDVEVPRAVEPVFQHALDTDASEADPAYSLEAAKRGPAPPSGRLTSVFDMPHLARGLQPGPTSCPAVLNARSARSRSASRTSR